MRDFTFIMHDQGDAVVVEIGGELDMAAAESMQMALTRVVVRRPKLTVIDLSAATLIASVSMGAIIAFHGGVKLHGGKSRLVVPPGNVRESLRRARIDQVIDMFETVDAALA